VPPQSGEASFDELIVTLPRRRRRNLYSAHNGVALTAGSSELEMPRPRSQARLRQRPPHPADVAQSQLFKALLLSDIDELEDRAATAERRWHRRCERKPDEVETLPHELKQLRQLITEARRLLDALHERFPPD
jgi:hypothetical protein